MTDGLTEIRARLHALERQIEDAADDDEHERMHATLDAIEERIEELERERGRR